MIFQREADFNRELKLERLRPVILLYGSEGYLQTLYRAKLEKLILGGQENSFDRQVLDGRALDVGQLYDAVEMLSLAAPARLVIVEDLEADKLSEGDLAFLCERMADLPKGCFLLLLTGASPFDPKKSKKAKKLLQAADKAGMAAELGARGRGDLLRFVTARCQKGGCTLPEPAGRLLLERCGDSMQTLEGETDKLIAYAEGGEITPEMVERVTSAAVSADIYQLSRLLCAGRTDKALALVGDLLALKTPAALILSNLGYALGDLVRARAALDQGKSQAQMVKDFHYRYEFRVKNALRDAKPIPADALGQAALLLARADRRLKSTGAQEQPLLEQTVVELAQALGGGAAR